MLEVAELTRPQTETTTRPKEISQTYVEAARPLCDPYWNFVPRTALIYSLPLILVALCLYLRPIGMSRAFWVPLALAFLILAPATRLSTGKAFAYKDYPNRDRFLITYALLPASVWYLAVNLISNNALVAFVFFVVLVVFDALLMRYQILCVYALKRSVQESALAKRLLRFSVPLWGYIALAMLAVEIFGRDTVVAILAASLLISLPVGLWWFYWRRRLAPAQRFNGIRNVAVVGAGWSGIYAVRWLNEAGLNVTCFESSDSVGGIWKYRPERPGGVFEATRVTSSKHFLHPSDFPFPETTPEFPHRGQVHAHLENYVDHFDIRRLFQLNTRVQSVDKVGDGWRVVTKNSDGQLEEAIFDAVTISSGPHQHPNIDYSAHPLYGNFSGRIMHSHEYKKSSCFSPGETVLVVGAGESSADIVAELVQAGAKVHWSSRSGQWFADRNMGPYPADHITTQGTRVFAGLFGFFEYSVRRFVTGAFVNLAWGRGGHGIPEWLPEAPYLHQFLNKSRDGVLEVYRGNAVARRGIVRIQDKNIYFAGDEEPLVVDTILLATGFRPQWPFLQEQPKALYKLVFNPDDPTLAFAGFARPIVGSIPSLSELQSRWIAAAWSGAVSIANREKRHSEMYFDTKHHKKLIRDGSELGMMVDQELYATELASQIDAHVHWFKLLLMWPRAFFILLISPWAPFKYLINDPRRDRRREALAHTIRELPTPRAPSYLLAIGVMTWMFMVAGVVILAFAFLPPPFALAALASLGLLNAIMLRLTARDRRPLRAPSKLREVFPF